MTQPTALSTHRSARSRRRRALAVALPFAISLGLAATAHAEEHEKAGPIMINAKLGPSIGLARFWPTQFALVFDGGYALTEDKSLYVTFSPQLQFGSFSIINFIGGAQYDIPLPVENLYIYPRVGLGLGIGIGSRSSGVAFAFQPEFGAKYLLTDQFHVGFEPLGFPIYAGKGGAAATYRMLAYGGMNL